MAEDLSAPTDGKEAQPAPASRGRWLAVFALLVALSAACGFALLYYLLVVNDPAPGFDDRLSRVEAAQTRLRSDLQDLAGERQTAFATFRAQLEERQRAAEDRLAETLTARLAGLPGEVAVGEPRSEREWKLAEVEFLLRAANQRARFERDSATSLELLRSADGVLEGLGGPAAHGIRLQIAAEILSLEQSDAVDPAAVYLRLDAIKRELTDLAVHLPEQPTFEPQPETTIENEVSEPGFFALLGRELAGLVRFRRIDTALERPPAAVERDLLEVSLRLMLEQAQLAALRRNQAVYAASLSAALDWARALPDGQNERLHKTIESLETLRDLNLETPLPDISGSLHELIEARRQTP